MKTAHRSWLKIALAKSAGEGTLVAAAGEHLGEAIAAAEAHVPGSFAVGVEPATTDSIPLGESVGKKPLVELASFEPVGRFAWPVGIVPQLFQQVAGATPSYTIHKDPAHSVFEALVARDDLAETFMGLVERLPAADNLEIKLLGSFDDARTTDVWLTSRVNAKKILAFLDDYDTELFGNGFLELGVYVRSKKATLRLTEHKTIVWVAQDRSVDGEVRRWFAELDIPRADELHTIEAVPHLHYRPAKSRDRKKLGQELYKQRMRRVATEPVPAASEG